MNHDMSDIGFDLEFIAKELGTRDLAIIRLKNQIEAILAVPGVQDALLAHRSQTLSVNGEGS